MGVAGAARSRITFVVGLFALLLVLVLPASVAAVDFGTRVSGQHVYDRAGVLSATEMADLEIRAAAVERAGAPTVVYLRLQSASASGTEDDAASLMSAWDVQSAPDARDGLVIFLNLNPSDPQHGQVALYVGAHQKAGNLPQYEVDRIVNQVMLPQLRQGYLAAGIGAGLEAAANSLIAGPPPPPPPSAFQRFMRAVAGSPISGLNIVSTLATALVLAVANRVYRAGPRRRAPVTPTTVVPGSRPPAEAGALVRGGVSQAQIEGTILDLSRRGALAVEPEAGRRIRVRLLDESVPETSYERAIWEILSNAASREGIVDTAAFRRVAGKWAPAQEALRHEIERQGLFDPDIARRRRPGFVVGGVGLAIGLAVVIVCAAGQQPYGAIGGGLLLTAAMVCLVIAAAVRATTEAGESEAGPWRDYEAGIKAARGNMAAVLDLDEVVPYAAALGVVNSLDRRLKDASAAGFAPTWLGTSLGAGWDGGFYPYWVAFHGSVAPASGGGTSAGGAAAGGAGASGSF